MRGYDKGGLAIDTLCAHPRDPLTQRIYQYLSLSLEGRPVHEYQVLGGEGRVPISTLPSNRRSLQTVHLK